MRSTGEPGPTDAWTTLAGLARDTCRIRLGTLMTAATFRLPGPLAITVAQVDQMSGGRVELGIGAGWFAEEHTAYGIPFPPAGGALRPAGGAARRHHRAVGDPGRRDVRLRRQVLPGRRLPGAAQAGAATPPADPARRQGPKRTPRLAARYADEFNLPFVSVDETAAQFGRVRAACAEVGRDPGTLRWSNALVLCCGRDDAEVARRAAAIGREPDELRQNGLAGTPAEVVDTIGRYAEVGSERIYLQVLDLADLDHLELVAAEVMPQL